MPSQLARKRPLSAVPPGPAPEAAPEVTLHAPSECSFCYGTGMEVVAGKGARRCRCRKPGRRERLLEAARIPSRYARCTLANYHPAPGQGTQLQAFNYAFKLVDEYPAVERGLLFTGPVGTGKFHPSNYPCRTESCATRDHHGY